MKTRLSVLAMFVLFACVTGKPIPKVTPSVLVKGGTFVFGSSRPCKEEFTCSDIVGSSRMIKAIFPPMEVTLNDFYIDAHEVTNAQYQYCVEMGACPERNFQTFPAAKGVDYNHDPTYNNFPAVGITYSQAEAYCAFVHKRLPTEFEWELVASGDHLVKAGEDIETAEKEKLEFPNDYEQHPERHINPATGKPMHFRDAVSSHSCNGIQIPECSTGLMPSPVGTNQNDVVQIGGGKVYDMTGNVSEWVRAIPVEPDGDHVEYVSCEDDLPDTCKDPHWYFNCDAVYNECKDNCSATDTNCLDKCQSQNAICKEDSSSNPECKSDAGVFRMCKDTSGGIPICKPYSKPVTQAQLFERFKDNHQLRTKTVVRGCSYGKNCWGYQGNIFVCGARSSTRHIMESIGPDDPTTNPQVGFRCASDLQ